MKRRERRGPGDEDGTAPDSSGGTMWEAGGEGRTPTVPERRLADTRELGRDSEAAETIGRYRILAELGRGGMGVVYRALDPELGREVALKMTLSATASEVEVERFRREARAAARLRHPHIVRIHDVGAWKGRPYYTMDFVAGESLATAAGRVSSRRYVEILRDVGKALGAAHAAGLVHRDVKPANVLVDGEGTPYVTDFGLAKLGQDVGSSRITASGAVLGTPSYMAPEQARGAAEEIGPWTDVWSLGVMLYEHLAGRTPFLGRDLVALLRAIEAEEPVPPSRLCRRSGRRVDRDLETICLKCLEKEPARRYRDAAELAADLDRHLEGLAVLARPVGPLGRLWRRARRRPVLAASSLSGAIALAAALAWGTGEFLARHAAEEEASRDEETRRLAAEEALGRRRRAEPHLDRARERLASARGIRYVSKEGAARARELWQEAFELAGRALVEDPSHVDALLVQARVEFDRHDLDRALAALERALAIEPSSSAAILLRGRIRLEQCAEEMMAGTITTDYGESGLSITDRSASSEEGRSRFELARADLEMADRLRETREGALYLEGLVAFVEGNYSAASERLSAVVRADPTDFEAARYLVRARTWGGDLEGAESAARDLTGLAPAAGWVDLSTILQRRGKSRESLAAAEKACERDPDSTAALDARCVALRALGDRETAMKDLERILELEPGSATAHYNRAQLAWEEKDYETAARHGRRAFELDWRLTLAGEVVWRSLVCLGRKAEALAFLGEYLEQRPRDFPVYRYRYQIRRDLEDPAASEEIGRMAALEPRTAREFLDRATAWAGLGRNEDALADVEEAIELAPDHPPGWLERGNVLYALDRKREALESYLEAAGRGSGGRELWWTIAALASELGAPDWDLVAQGACDRVLAIDPSHIGARRLRMQLLREDAKFEDALGDADELVRLEPDDPVHRCTRATILLSLGEYDRALADLDRARELDPAIGERPEIDYHHMRFHVWEKKGDMAAGLLDLDRAVRKEPERVEILSERGAVLERIGRHEEAARDYERVAELDPARREEYLGHASRVRREAEER